MVKPETRLRRHAQLWESGTTGARRAAIGGLIFAVLILLRVVEPYHAVERDRAQAEADLANHKAAVQTQQEQLAVIERTLQEIEDELEQEPWNVERDKLIQYFRDRRSGGSDDLAVPQDKANETITNIVDLVESRVIEKLRRAIAAPGDTFERLANYPDKIQLALDTWKKKNYDNTNWYFTQKSKNETIRGMSAVLSALKTEALAAVVESKSSLSEKRAEIAEEDAAIQEKFEAATATIDDELDAILPAWAQKSVRVKSMIVFYPWLIVLFVATMVGKAVVAARHFHGMADEEQWTAEERSNPLVSSPWTLTWRGATGTLATVVTYLSVIFAFWFCLHRALEPASANGSETGDTTTVADSSQTLADAIAAVLPANISYALLLAALAVVVAMPTLRGMKKS